MDGRSFAPALLAKAEETPVPRTTTMLVEFYSLSSGSPDTPPCAPDASAATESAEDAEGSVAAAGLCYDTHASHSDWVSSPSAASRIGLALTLSSVGSRTTLSSRCASSTQATT